MKRIIYVLTLLALTPAFSQSAIHVEKSGKGNAVVFLPGFTTPGSVWNETIKNLDVQKENHVVSYAGFNGLEPIATPWYEQLKNELVSYVKTEKLSNVTIIGHSMGGNLAIDIAAELPDQISGLILVESIPCMRELMMPGVPASSLQYDSPYNNQMLEMNDEAFKQMATNMAQYMTFDQSKMEVLSEWSIKADRKTYVYGYTDLLKLDLRDKLSSITSKTLILGASFPDKNVVLANYEKQYDNLAEKEILISEHSKHFIMFDDPTWFYENVNSFLSANDL
jgi:pimeloyl-ACP methyl ester carboxylesterase